MQFALTKITIARQSYKFEYCQKKFHNAQEVLAWVGKEGNNSAVALQTLMQIRTLTLEPDVWPSNLPLVPPSWSPIPEWNDRVWDDIGMFFKRLWFGRAWVVQEVVFARDVRLICGDWDVRWDDIFDALEACIQTIDPVRLPTLGVSHLFSHTKSAYTLSLTRKSFAWSRHHPRLKLLPLLYRFSYTDVLREQDKLFVLLRLSKDRNDEAFNPNYSSSLKSIIQRFACRFVERRETLGLLYRAGSDRSYDFCS
jgi:hypothetical protein